LGKGIIAGIAVAVVAVVALAVMFVDFSGNDESDDTGDETYRVRSIDMGYEIKLSGWSSSESGMIGPWIGEPNDADWCTMVFHKDGGTLVNMFQVSLYVFGSVEGAQDAFSVKKAKATSTSDISGAFDQCIRYYPDATHLYVFQYMNVYGWVNYAINLSSAELNALFASIEEVLYDNLA